MKDIINITEKGIEEICNESKRYMVNGKKDPASRASFSYKLHALTAYTISRQVLACIEANQIQLAQTGYNHLRSKLAELREGFSREYTSITDELEATLIGANSKIKLEASKKGVKI